MSTDGAIAAAAHQGASDRNHGGNAAGSHASLRGYLIGFGLAVVLTAVAFWLVMSGVLDNKRATGLVIAALAMAQIVVHMIYFLHMNTRSEGGWIMMALIFTLVMVVIGLVGSIWVMYHLNANMMPGAGLGPMP